MSLPAFIGRCCCKDMGLSEPSEHKDPFCRDRLPATSVMPDFLQHGEGNSSYPVELNAAVELSDVMAACGYGDKVALIGAGQHFTYADVVMWSNKIARVLVDDIGIVPGNRVLIRSYNNPVHVICWLAATKAGAVVINTAPQLRARELQQIIDEAAVEYALCDLRLRDALEACQSQREGQSQDQSQKKALRHIVFFDGRDIEAGDLGARAHKKRPDFCAAKTSRDDVALMAATSGSTGTPKITMHYHRDILAIADGYAADILRIRPEDKIIGTPPLAFTYGLGALAVFPLRFGASAILEEHLRPEDMCQQITAHQASLCFSSPAAYRMMLDAMAHEDFAVADLSSLRAGVSAGDTLPAPVYEAWQRQIGVPLLDGIGSTEMLHIFISNRLDEHEAACTGRPVRGYVAKVVDERGETLPKGQAGRLAVKGPTGCRYLHGKEQTRYVQDGWNYTGDCFYQDEGGRFHFVARMDEMIISSGYNIAGREVEAALLTHRDVLECAVIGVPDELRGAIVEAHVVLRAGLSPTDAKVRQLQDHVKAVIAPYKYPRSIVFRESLPKTETGKMQRYLLQRSGHGQEG